MESKFIKKSIDLLNSISCKTGEDARLANSLSVAINMLSAIEDEANKQFRAGEMHAKFSYEMLDSIYSGE